jgi:multisubunit Na+/H+ antiporter MnhB subunit
VTWIIWGADWNGPDTLGFHNLALNMPKRYLLVRTLRCATILCLLATGLERLRQLIFPHRTGLRVRAIAAAVTVGCIVLFFEVARQALDPKTSIWTTHTITILFTMLAAAALTFAALNTKAEGALRQSEAVHLSLSARKMPSSAKQRKVWSPVGTERQKRCTATRALKP